MRRRYKVTASHWLGANLELALHQSTKPATMKIINPHFTLYRTMSWKNQHELFTYWVPTMQDCCISSVIAMEIPLSCIKPTKCFSMNEFQITERPHCHLWTQGHYLHLPKSNLSSYPNISISRTQGISYPIFNNIVAADGLVLIDVIASTSTKVSYFEMKTFIHPTRHLFTNIV